MTGNIFALAEGDACRETMTDLLTSEHVTVRRIVTLGQTSPENGWYDQDDNEWVVVLSGAGELTFEDGKTIRMGPGDYLNIPAHTRHRVSWTVPDKETIWLAVHYT